MSYGVKTRMEWDRGNLAEWRASHSDARKCQDEKLLSGIFNLAAKVPQMKEALDWANAHGIEFVVDRTTKKANGYYSRRTGVVALSAHVLADPAKAVGTVTHEIRHAWQDWHGLLARRPGRFADYFAALALVEADAEAFGARARQEYALRQRQEEYRGGLYRLLPVKGWIEKIDRQVDLLQKDPETLWQGFKDWFARGRALTYGQSAMEKLARELGVPDIVPKNYNLEFKPFGDREPPPHDAVDFRQEDQLHRLGRSFSGQNYFDGKGRRGYLQSVFNVELAERFYSPERKRPKLMDEIRKRALLLKLHKGRDMKPLGS